MDADIGSMVLLLSDIDILCAPFQVFRLVSLDEMRIPDKELWTSTDERQPRMQTWGDKEVSSSLIQNFWIRVEMWDVFSSIREM